MRLVESIRGMERATVVRKNRRFLTTSPERTGVRNATHVVGSGVVGVVVGTVRATSPSTASANTGRRVCVCVCVCQRERESMLSQSPHMTYNGAMLGLSTHQKPVCCMKRGPTRIGMRVDRCASGRAGLGGKRSHISNNADLL
jgi:hypothetical protein